MSRAIRSTTGTQARTRKQRHDLLPDAEAIGAAASTSPRRRCCSALLMLFPMVMVLRYSLMDGAIMKKNAAFAGLQNYADDLRRSGVLAVGRATRSISP